MASLKYKTIIILEFYNKSGNETTDITSKTDGKEKLYLKFNRKYELIEAMHH